MTASGWLTWFHGCTYCKHISTMSDVEELFPTSPSSYTKGYVEHRDHDPARVQAERCEGEKHEQVVKFISWGTLTKHHKTKGFS